MFGLGENPLMNMMLMRQFMGGDSGGSTGSQRTTTGQTGQTGQTSSTSLFGGSNAMMYPLLMGGGGSENLMAMMMCNRMPGMMRLMCMSNMA
ncbi:hypothetical protein DPMN_130888 [Dreissena polymorpha]|uniref:Uncharacterized protein n=1 Tax=Dreissena polymorpha TaxID=45954 RepID=A0A9D4K221_DREPO|nr:hypothetical protein DPMN_130888 [Dreissena polymorpha]